MIYEYFCLLCNETQPEAGKFQHTCPNEAVISRRVPTRWRRFCDWFWSLDINYILAFSGGLLINAVLINHFNYTIIEASLQGIGIGLLLPGLLTSGGRR